MSASILKATRQSRTARAAVLLAAWLWAALAAQADAPTYYWDLNDAGDGAGDPVDGDWYLSTPCWTSDSWGTSATFPCAERANLIFAANGDSPWYATPDYTVTVFWSAPVSDLQFKDGNCTLTTPAPYYLDKDTPFISVVGEGQTATINSIIASKPGTSNGLTKFAFGTLVLGCTNTYRGPTTIEGGVLRLGAPQVLPPASTLVLAGGDTRPDAGYSSTSPTFDADGHSQTLGPLSLTGPYTNLVRSLDFGQGASALAFGDSHTQDWGGMILRIENYTPGVDSLRFGTNSGGLTAAQLQLMRFADFLDVPGRIDANGYVTPVPPPTLSIKVGSPTTRIISWDAISGRNYNLQYKTSPADAYWVTNAILDIVATSATAAYTNNVGTNAQRCYRVRLQPISSGT